MTIVLQAEMPQPPSKLEAAQAVLDWFRETNDNVTEFERLRFIREVNRVGRRSIPAIFDQFVAELNGQSVVSLLIDNGDLASARLNEVDYLRVASR